MAWKYLQTGYLFTPEGQPAARHWYSGHRAYANQPSAENLPGLGPIPRGNYTMTELLRDTHMGPVAIHLQPDDETMQRIREMGREPWSFFAHADSMAHDHNASAGCLVCVEGTVGVMSLWDSADHALVVESGLDPVT